MALQKVGIILNGVTGRMGTNQHLVRSILAIIQQGGIRVSDDLTLMPDPVLTGRNENKLRALSEKFSTPASGPIKYTTNLQKVLDDPQFPIFFDSSATLQRAGFVEKAAAAQKAIYCEKPTAVSTAEALRLARVCEKAGVKNGVVQDKLWLPGIRKLQMLKEQGFFGKILSVRGEFGYWVFDGTVSDQPAQRPSWNYRSEDGGGIIIDMLCHWRYLIDNVFGNVKAVSCLGATHLPERVGENGKSYACTADDSAYATFELDNGVICQFNSSWTVRVRRDDLLTLQVDGTHGTAVAGLRKCWAQHISATPKPTWNPDIDSPIVHNDHWQEVPSPCEYDNAFKIQWELFIKHVVLGTPFRWTLREGSKGVQLAEAGIQSWKERRWVNIDPLD
jgi:predicted dehydrogenase